MRRAAQSHCKIMHFSISFLPERVTSLNRGEKAAYGIIQIGDFQERFISSLNFWRIDDYKKHWRKALERVVGGEDRSCLITSLTNPKRANFITWWPIYRKGDSLYFQNQCFFLEKLKTDFDPDDPYDQVLPRKT